MLRRLFDFEKKKSLPEALVFYLFFVGCFVLVSAVFHGEI